MILCRGSRMADHAGQGSTAKRAKRLHAAQSPNRKAAAQWPAKRQGSAEGAAAAGSTPVAPAEKKQRVGASSARRGIDAGLYCQGDDLRLSLLKCHPYQLARVHAASLWVFQEALLLEEARQGCVPGIP